MSSGILSSRHQRPSTQTSKHATCVSSSSNLRMLILNLSSDNEKAPTVNPPHNLKETTPQSREVDDLMTIHEAKAHEYMLGKVPAVSEDSSSAAEDEDTESSGPSSSPRSINDPSGDNQRHHSPHGMTESAFTDEGLRHPSPDTVRRIIQMGRNSPGSRSERRYTAPPVSYIPADQPNGPRQLPPDRYSCPLTGCHCPLGAEKEGYDRKGLGYHILLSHGGSDNMLEVRQQVRDRVMALRSECGRGVGATGSPFWRSHRSTFDLQLQMDGLVRDLDEIREWEHTRRFIVPPSSWGTWIEFNQLRQSEEDEFARENHANEYQCGFSSPFLPRVNPFARQGGKPSHQSKEEIRVQQELELCHSMTVQRRFEAIHVQSPRSAGHGFCPVNSSQDNLDTGHCELNLGGNSMDID